MDWSHQKQNIRKRSCRALVESPSHNITPSTIADVNGGDRWCSLDESINGNMQVLSNDKQRCLTTSSLTDYQKEQDVAPLLVDSDKAFLPAKRPKRIEIETEYRGKFQSGISGFPSLTPYSRQYDLLVTEVEGGGCSQKALCKNTISDELFTVSLNGIWADTMVSVGSSIRLIEPKVIDEKSAARCKSSKVTREWLLHTWRKQYCSSFLQQLVAMNMTPSQVEDELSVYLDSITDWIDRYMPPPLGRSEPLSSGSCIEQVADIEENIWDHFIGIKGKVDVSLQVRTKNSKRLVEPLELKTGKSKLSVEHDGQVLLYCLALSSRIPNLGAIGDGMLLYVKDCVARPVQPRLNELKGILHLRNEVAAYFGSVSEKSLPAPLSDTRSCKWCECATVCCALQKTVESSHCVSASMLALQSSLTSHLSANHLEYFQKWIRWIVMEWNAAKSVKADVRDIWKVDSRQREEMGRCLADMCIDVSNANEDCTTVKFKRKSGSPIQAMFAKGDMVVVSNEKNIAFAMGPVEAVDESSVELLLSNDSTQLKSGTNFILDKYESFSTYSTNLSNVALLMEPSDHASKIRSLLIDMDEPKFSRIAKDEVARISSIVRPLNGEQARAVVKSLIADDYLLIEGLPGKTSTVAVLVRCFLMLGRSVLITSYTHSAVDNLLLKLIRDVDTKDILRIGDGRSIRKELLPLTLQAKLAETNDGDKEFERAQCILKQTPIVACTCLAVATNSLFSYRRFSICLVDEASLIVESALLPALLVSDSFVLVGDSLQLSPLVQSRTAREEGMSQSLFERLKVHKSAVITLKRQYRMNRAIAKLSSALFYKEGLQLNVSNGVDGSVVFIDTQSPKNSECRMEFGASPGAVYNSGEIKIVNKICCLFIRVNTVDQYQGRDKRVIIVSLVWTERDGARRSELLSDARRVNVAITRAKHKLILVGCKQSMMSYETMAALIGLIPESQIKSIAEPSKEGTDGFGGDS
ncbi:unnamed protein product [Toxocara canis]|uniref:DNA replication ATP-dependent helicase/nuclease n=1 Tax=Toxocara canis TaxID=6265 RepID=A0A183V0D2_TOXCA|nr:unnamed protein product [Toxocara canis]